MNHTQTYSPAQFMRLINPAMARVYVEVFDAQMSKKSSSDVLLWDDPVVVNTFCALMNVSIERFENVVKFPSSLEEQIQFVARSRILNQALWLADEEAELDGQAAIDFASGWLRGKDWIDDLPVCRIAADEVCPQNQCPSSEFIDQKIAEQMLSSSPIKPDAFMAGFKRAVGTTIGSPDCCSIKPVDFNNKIAA